GPGARRSRRPTSDASGASPPRRRRRPSVHPRRSGAHPAAAGASCSTRSERRRASARGHRCRMATR
ncbi:MAG: tRNA (N6-isopentenyl adenosine(37)-C2)-methylthiotransferase MiaB, partial [Chloroflexi bacterium]